MVAVGALATVGSGVMLGPDERHFTPPPAIAPYLLTLDHQPHTVEGTARPDMILARFANPSAINGSNTRFASFGADAVIAA